MSVVLAGPYDSRSYVIGSYVLYVTQEKCETFFYQLMPMKTERWKDWLRNTCEEEEWDFEKLKREKVLSWWEQNYSGGPKVLLGGLSVLLEYMKDKYGVSRDLTPEQVDELIEQSTEHWKKFEEEEAKNKGSGGNISIVGAGSNEAVPFLIYALMTTKTPVIRSGINIKLFESHDDRQEQLKKTVDRMSTVESNINICIVDDLLDVFKNCDLLIFLGDKFRTTGMDIEKFLYLEKVRYSAYGFLCNYNMEDHTMVIFACMENAAFNATCFLAEAPIIDKRKVIALTSYLGTELKLYISKAAGFPVESLEQIPVWGMADTCHLVDVDMGSLIFRVPDHFNPKYPNIKALARLIEDETLRAKLYKMWKFQQDKCVAEWRWSKIKENLKIEEIKADIRSKRLEVLNSLESSYKEAEKRCSRVPYWRLWKKSMAEVVALEGENYYSPENMYKRFKRGFYEVVQDNRYFEKEKEKKEKKLEDDYNVVSEKAEALADYMDPLKLGMVDPESIRKFLETEFFENEMKKLEEDDGDELCDETEIPGNVRDIELLRREVYYKRNELKKKIRSYWKRHMEEEIARLENELRRKSHAQKGEENLEEEWMEEENMCKLELQSDKVSTNTPKSASETTTMDKYANKFYEEEERFEETVPVEIKLPEREVLNRMIKDYFRTKMKLERKVKEDLEKESESGENYSYEEIDDYEIRELGFITRRMQNLWNFVGVCKNAVRKKIGQDPYIAQVHELIRVLKIWYFDPYMASETTFLGIASDSDVFPFLTDTVMSQPAYCDENFRWQPFKEAKHLWPKTPLEKIPDNAETDVPFFRTPREGLPLTIQFVLITSIECLMHFKIPPASYFEVQKKLQKHADQKEFCDLVFTMREADRAQFKDLFRRMGQDVESSDGEFVIDEEEEEEEEVAEGAEEAEIKFDTNLEGEMDLEGEEELREEVNPEELGTEGDMAEEEHEPLRETKPDLNNKVNLPIESQIKELDKLGKEEFEASLEEELSDYEGAEDIEIGAEEFKNEYEEDDPLDFLRGYQDLTDEQFLAIFEKQRDPEKELSAESEKKPPRRTKSVWKWYLEKIGFYNLDIPEIILEEEEEEEVVEEEEEADNKKSKVTEKPNNPFQPKNDEDVRNSEETTKEEDSGELPEEMMWKKIEKKMEEDPNYQTRGIGFIENLERDFCPQDFTEMPFYENFHSGIKIDIAEKGIHETHTKKIGFPIECRSQLDMGQDLNKIDIGKNLIRSSVISETNENHAKYQQDEKEPFQVSVKSHGARASTSILKGVTSQVLTPGILTVSLPTNDGSEDSITDSFIPDNSISSNIADESKDEASVSLPQKEGDSLLELFKEVNKEQEEYLMNQKESSEDDESSSSLHQENLNFSQKKNHTDSNSNEKQPNREWVHELLEKINSPTKIGAMDRAAFLDSFTPTYNLLKEKQRLDAEKEKNTPINAEENVIADEESLVEKCIREAWLSGFEKVKRIMDLEKISGHSFLHFELDEEHDRLKVEVAHEKQRQFSDWVGSVINEHEQFQSIRYTGTTAKSSNGSKPVSKSEESGSTKKIKSHHDWINQMIREIIMLDQIYDLENVIQSVKLSSKKLTPDETSATETDPQNTIRVSMLEKMENKLKDTTGESDSEVMELSDDDIFKKEEEEDLHLDDRERIQRELMKTEKEITKDCHDLRSYVQKCRENNRLYSLYHGDIPRKWRFLSIQPNESKTKFKYKALIHMMVTVNKLEEDFQKEMARLMEQDLDYTKVLSSTVDEEELKTCGFMSAGKCETVPNQYKPS